MGHTGTRNGNNKVTTGSSPHTWGIPTDRRHAPDIPRFIPTYVGHTFPKSLAVLSKDGSSPHTWGIRFENFGPPSGIGGSSPHTWGIRKVSTITVACCRFIPTYVGHTLPFWPKIQISSVHPHIRGAYLDTETIGLDGAGSSPHTWGILSVHVGLGVHNRFIPTYVGHTGGAIFIMSSITVHPHIRGAYFRYSVSNIGGGGSSPHTWGIPVQRTGSRQDGRFIPTYVGHTVVRFGVAGLHGVHPHIRGAYLGEMMR